MKNYSKTTVSKSPKKESFRLPSESVSGKFKVQLGGQGPSFRKVPIEDQGKVRLGGQARAHGAKGTVRRSRVHLADIQDRDCGVLLTATLFDLHRLYVSFTQVAAIRATLPQRLSPAE